MPNIPFCIVLTLGTTIIFHILSPHVYNLHQPRYGGETHSEIQTIGINLILLQMNNITILKGMRENLT